jgi:hypothetical protein
MGHIVCPICAVVEHWGCHIQDYPVPHFGVPVSEKMMDILTFIGKGFLLLMIGSGFLMYGYIQYTKRIKVRDHEIVLGETDTEEVWLEAWDEVLKESV